MAARQTRQSLVPLRGVVLLAAAAGLGGCQLPSVNLATNEPIKVDIAMRLDVYQHNAGDPKPEASPTPPPASVTRSASPGSPTDAATRAKDRAAEIQVLKNSRLVGEGREGLVVVITEPDGDYGEYVRRTVAAENRDRMTQMKAAAEAQKRSLPEIQQEQAALWLNRSFKGEWIETKDANGRFRWVQKEG